MTVRAIVKGNITGNRDGEPWPAVGEEIDLPDWEFEALRSQGIVGPVAEVDEDTKRSRRSDKTVGPEETAVADAPETPESKGSKGK